MRVSFTGIAAHWMELIQAKLNASMYLKVQSLGFKFARILR